MPEPMKSELLAANDVVEMKRLGGGKVEWARSLFKELGKWERIHYWPMLSFFAHILPITFFLSNSYLCISNLLL